MHQIIYYLIALLILITKINGDPNEQMLIKNLLEDYNPMVRPCLKYSDKTFITIRFSVDEIIDLDEKNQALIVYGWLLMGWKDPKLSWNQSEYDGIDYVRLAANVVWTPDVVLNNAVDKLVFDTEKTNVLVSSKGDVFWAINEIFRSSCSIDTNYFPFDEQNCSLNFVLSLTYPPERLALNLTGNTSAISLFLRKNGEWKVQSFTASMEKNGNINFNLFLRRKPLFYVFTMMLPCLITVAVAFLAFLIPANSGEKMSISITTLLSISVLLLVVSDDLPPNSDSIPLIGEFYAVSTFLISLISVASVITLNLHHYGDNGDPVPIVLQLIFFGKFGKIMMFPKKIYVTIHNFKVSEKQMSNNIKDNKTSKADEKESVCAIQIKSKSTDTKKTKRNLVKFETVQSNELEKNEKEIKLQWALLADIVDRILFYIFLVITFTTLFYVVNRAPNSKLF